MVVDPSLECRERNAPLLLLVHSSDWHWGPTRTVVRRSTLQGPVLRGRHLGPGRSSGADVSLRASPSGLTRRRRFAAASAGTDADGRPRLPVFRPLALPSGICVGVAAVCTGRYRFRTGADGLSAEQQLP